MVLVFYKNEGKTRFVIAFKIMIGLCYFSPLPCTQRKRVSVESVSSTTFGHKSCICSTIDSCRLFLHRVSSHHYLYHRQNIYPTYPSSKSKELVKVVIINLSAFLETAIGQASGFSLLANDNSRKIHVIMLVIRNKEDSIWHSSLNVLFNG